MKKKIWLKRMTWGILGLPLLGAVVASLLPLTMLSQQLLVAIVLVWVQVFFIFNIFLSGH